MAYLAAAEGGRFVRTVVAFREEVQVLGGDGNQQGTLVVSGAVLEKAWAKANCGKPLSHAQQTGLEAAILAHLAAAEGGRFARAAAAFKEEAQIAGGGGDDHVHLAVSGAVLEKAWMLVHRALKKTAKKGALLDAIKAGDLAEVQLHACVGDTVEMLKGYMPDDDEDDEIDEDDEFYQASPLHWAAIYNHLEIVRFYVESGHDKEVGSEYGQPPLMAAARKGHLEVVRYLVEQGADKNVKCGVDSPFSTAAYRGHLEVVRYLGEQGVDNTTDDIAVQLAILEGQVDVLEYLLDVRHVDIDRVDHFGRTALHLAASEGQLEVAQVLFRYGATLDMKDNRGDTPTDLAIRAGNHHIADAIRAEEIRRRDHGFKRDRSTIEGTEEHEAAKRPRAEREAAEAEAAAAEAAAAADESDDDDDDEDDDEEEDG